MNPWLMPYYWFNKAPLSGDVTQDIAPYTNFLSPQIDINFAGDRRVEHKVVSEVASYGKQLGIITEALLQLTADNNSQEVVRLRELYKEIEKVKEKNKTDLEKTAKDALDKLKETDPAALERVVSDYS